MMKKLTALFVTACMLVIFVPAAAFAYSTGGDQTAEPAVTQEIAATEADTEVSAEAPEEVETEIPEFEATEEGGWTQDAATGKWTYILNGMPVKGAFLTLGTTKYYFDYNGFMVVDWQTIEGHKYYFDPTPGTPGTPGSTTGVMKTGWWNNNGTKYYFDPQTGIMKTGWLTLYNEKYYFKANGAMKTGWLKLNGNRYYFKNNGQIVTGTKTINGHKYYFLDSGRMATGWVTRDGSKYYYNTNNGRLKTGWLKLNGKRYYLNDKSGKMCTGLKTISGYKYYFADSGVMQTGAKKINGSLYYFFSSGRAPRNTGWFKGSDGKTRYCIGGGKVATGKKQIGRNWYEFSKKTGVCLKNLGDNYDQAIKNMSSRTSYLIQVIKSKYQVRVYSGSKGNWTKKYTFTCGIGDASHPTPSGTFTVEGKTAHHNYKTGGKDAHWNNGLDLTGSGPKGNGFNGVVWSDTYPDGSVIDDQLGGRVTGGRIRVSEGNSAWLYNNIKTGTTVYIH